MLWQVFFIKSVINITNIIVTCGRKLMIKYLQSKSTNIKSSLCECDFEGVSGESGRLVVFSSVVIKVCYKKSLF